MGMGGGADDVGLIAGAQLRSRVSDLCFSCAEDDASLPVKASLEHSLSTQLANWSWHRGNENILDRLLARDRPER